MQPRGKAWRRALAAKINAERLGRWKQVGRPAPRPTTTNSEDCATGDALMLPFSHPQGEEMLRQRVPAPASLPARA